VAAALTGCGGSGGTAPTPGRNDQSDAGTSAPVTYRVGSSAGYATFQAISENRRFLDHARNELTRRCMAAAGFQYWPALDLPKEYSDPARPLTVEGAQTRGYHSLDVPPDRDREAAISAYFATLSDAQQQEYQRSAEGPANDVYKFHTFLGDGGYPRHGCAGNSVSQITDKPAEFVRLELIMTNLTDAPEYRPDADPGLKAPRARWRSCMTDAGYDFTSPRAAQVKGGQLDSAAARKAGLELEPDAPSPAALALAVADAKCRASSGWNDAYARAVRNALAVVIDAHESDVLAWEDISAAAVTKAKAVLSK
jgi:hypothetical protein